jgi:hypothetical protein
VYNDQDNPSTTFTEFSGSYEYRQISSTRTDRIFFSDEGLKKGLGQLNEVSWLKSRCEHGGLEHSLTRLFSLTLVLIVAQVGFGMYPHTMMAFFPDLVKD